MTQNSGGRITDTRRRRNAQGILYPVSGFCFLVSGVKSKESNILFRLVSLYRAGCRNSSTTYSPPVWLRDGGLRRGRWVRKHASASPHILNRGLYVVLEIVKDTKKSTHLDSVWQDSGDRTADARFRKILNANAFRVSGFAVSVFRSLE